MMSRHALPDAWHQYIPALHQALAHGEDELMFPQPLARMELAEICAAWNTLHYLFTGLLGWSSPAHGLAWWYKAGKPVESSLLKLARNTWDKDGELDYYAAWLWRNGAQPFDLDTMTTGAIAQASLYPDEDWWRQFKRRGQTLRHDPFYGGGNSLHLGSVHDVGIDPVGPEEDRAILHQDRSRRHAVLIANSLTTWRTDLAAHGSKLPSLGERSWHVEVFDRQYGFIGQFRQSRVTDRWFMGQHNIHVPGCLKNFKECAA